MTNLVDVIVTVLVLTGAFFTFVGSFGLVRMSHFMQRLHSPTKATTLGVGGLLWASIVFFYSQQGVFSTNELLITLFLFITAPISAHFMARAYLHQQRESVKQQMPLPSQADGWSFDAASDASSSSPNGLEPAAHDSH